MSRNLAQLWDRPARRSWELDVAWRDPKQLIGIEVETEVQGSVCLPDARTIQPTWEKGSDGSLRNGYEYRLSAPLAGSSLSSAINQFFHPGVTLERALTSGTHIHIDMMEETTNVTSVQALVLLVYILEPAIFGIIDVGREFCGYTNGLETAPPVLLNAVLRDGLEDNPQELLKVTSAGKTYKYYGLNLMPLARFGSVEFRYFPTATSSAELIDWIQLVQAFKVASVSLVGKEGVAGVLANVSSYEEFVRGSFDTWAEAMLEHVPYALAVKRYHQALFTTSTNLGEVARFDSAILRTKQFGKFARKATKLEDQLGAGGSLIPMDIDVQCMRIGDFLFDRQYSDWSIVVARDATYIKHPTSGWSQFSGSNGNGVAMQVKGDPAFVTAVLPYREAIKAKINSLMLTATEEARGDGMSERAELVEGRAMAACMLLDSLQVKLVDRVAAPQRPAPFSINFSEIESLRADGNLERNA